MIADIYLSSIDVLDIDFESQNEKHPPTRDDDLDLSRAAVDEEFDAVDEAGIA